MFCSENGIWFKIAFVPDTVNVLKPRQKHDFRQCSKMLNYNMFQIGKHLFFFEVIIHLAHIFKWKINYMLFVACGMCSFLTHPELYAISLFKKYFADLCSKLTLVDVLGHMSRFLNCFQLHFDFEPQNSSKQTKEKLYFGNVVNWLSVYLCTLNFSIYLKKIKMNVKKHIFFWICRSFWLNSLPIVVWFYNPIGPWIQEHWILVPSKK